LTRTSTPSIPSRAARRAPRFLLSTRRRTGRLGASAGGEDRETAAPLRRHRPGTSDGMETVGREPLGDGAADAARGSRDECDAAADRRRLRHVRPPPARPVRRTPRRRRMPRPSRGSPRRGLRLAERPAEELVRTSPGPTSAKRENPSTPIERRVCARATAARVGRRGPRDLFGSGNLLPERRRIQGEPGLPQANLPFEGIPEGAADLFEAIRVHRTAHREHLRPEGRRPEALDRRRDGPRLSVRTNCRPAFSFPIATRPPIATSIASLERPMTNPIPPRFSRSRGDLRRGAARPRGGRRAPPSGRGTRRRRRPRTFPGCSPPPPRGRGRGPA